MIEVRNMLLDQANSKVQPAAIRKLTAIIDNIQSSQPKAKEDEPKTMFTIDSGYKNGVSFLENSDDCDYFARK